MRTIYILGILVLLALAVPAAPAHAGGDVTVCDESHLLAALAGGGTVTFACSGTITLTSTIVISTDTTIDGSGQAVTISGNNVVRVFAVNGANTFSLNGLGVVNGAVPDFELGGGILNWGTLYVSNSKLSGNSAYYGGGINNFGTLVVTNSTFSGNAAYYGGGINNILGTATVSTSTFAGNSATGSGGGINTHDNSTTTVTNSTFSGNRAHDGGGINNFGTLAVINSTFSGNSADGYGDGICNSGIRTVTLKNTIVSNSLPGGNCYGPITDGGGNLSYPDTSCPGINADPMLGPLQNNGGPTQTMALGADSAAIDAGIDVICAAPPVNNLDQRWVTRPQGSCCDIGAVEQILEPAVVSLDALSAESLPGAFWPTMIAGLLLVALVGISVQQRSRHA